MIDRSIASKQHHSAAAPHTIPRANPSTRLHTHTHRMGVGRLRAVLVEDEEITEIMLIDAQHTRQQAAVRGRTARQAHVRVRVAVDRADEPRLPAIGSSVTTG